MKKFTYTIADPVGIHAHPARLLVGAIKDLDSIVTIIKADGKSVEGTELMALMSLNIKKGDTITVTVEGGHEEGNSRSLAKFFADIL